MCFDCSFDLLPPVDHQVRLWLSLTPACEKHWGEKVSWFPEALAMSLVLPYVAWTVSAATEGTKNGGEALKCECKWWIQDSCGTCLVLQTGMVWGSSQPRWSLPVRMGFTSWVIFRVRQSTAIISSLPFSGLEQLYPLQQWWKKKQRLVFDVLI